MDLNDTPTSAGAPKPPRKPRPSEIAAKKARKRPKPKKLKKKVKQPARKVKKTVAKTKRKPTKGQKTAGVVRSERLDMRLSKAEKAKVFAKATKLRRTVTSIMLEAIEKIK